MNTRLNSALYSWSNKARAAELRTLHARVPSNNGWRNSDEGIY